jgi:Flp pilus assembly protein TadG
MNMSANLRAAIAGLARRLSSDRRGQSVVEFAVALPFLVLMAVGTFAVGMVIDRHLTLGQLARNAGNMFARGISFTSDQNKQFLVDAATGLGMTLDGGNAVVYLSLLEKIPANADCGAGPGSCANAGEVVIAQRFTVGNTSMADSRFGMPSNIGPDGNHTDFFDDPDARASVPASLTSVMADNEILYAVEAFHEPSTLAFQGIFAPSMMYSRAFF